MRSGAAPWRCDVCARSISRARSASGTTFWVPGRQVPKTDLSVRQLVADDDREMCLVAGGGFELPAELAPAELRPGGDPRPSQVRGDREPGGGRIRVGADDDGHGRRLGRGHDTGLGQSEEQPVQPDPEADPGRRPPAEQLDEAVVAPAATDRLLLALAAGDVELERGPRVVVEPADEPGLEPIAHAEGLEVRADAGEVLGAGVAQPVRDLRRPRVERGHRRVLRIEQAQDVALEATAFELGQRLEMTAVVGGQLGDVGRPAFLVADRIEEDLDAVEAGVAIEARAELDDLGVDRRVRRPRSLRCRTARTGDSGRPAGGRSGTSARSRSASPAAATSASRAGRRRGRCRPSARGGATTIRPPRSAARAGRAPSRRCRSPRRRRARRHRSARTAASRSGGSRSAQRGPRRGVRAASRRRSRAAAGRVCHAVRGRWAWPRV